MMTVTKSEPEMRGSLVRVSLLVLAVWLPLSLPVVFVLTLATPLQALLPEAFARTTLWAIPAGTVAGVAAYCAHALTNWTIAVRDRWLWPLAFLIAAALTMPAYWWLQVRRTPTAGGGP